ncbi:MAG: DNA repair protein RecO [Rickettsia sp.]|nr:DNA repair protein RecO [Rickettsia sp.]
MRFRDKGIILSKKLYAEKSYILRVFTENHGIYSALLYGKKNANILHEGSLIDVIWTARLEEHLGVFKCDLIKSFLERIYFDQSKILALRSALNLTKIAFKEREPQIKFFHILHEFLNIITKIQIYPIDYIFFEINLLEAAGYGIDTTKCVVTGKKENLKFLSPKSGKAVCREIGQEYSKKLFLLPECLIYPPQKKQISLQELLQSLKILSYFINRYVFPNVDSCSYRKLLFNSFLSQ